MMLEKIKAAKSKNQKLLAILIDPDRFDENMLNSIENANPDFVFIGGSLITEGGFEKRVAEIKAKLKRPLILFPGHPSQVTPHVDSVLFLSLISGRNPDLLIGQHVVAAPRIKELGLETIATGYILIDGGKPTTASYISGTQPIPRDKANIAAATAMAGEMLGLQCIYLDAGSGASLAIPTDLIRAVSANTQIPLIVGGGIRTKEQIRSAFDAGADLVVIGTAIEEQPDLLASLLA
ncbi:MAG: geranylgeranylglyceryl/heptaprenylglyceryl phosphate synthase [Flavobacteriales bacterium]|nr:geranylgeranylglyceryl/heptaprenylglyceryl phosphate synthase [Flavobacteriales bacterium]